MWVPRWLWLASQTAGQHQPSWDQGIVLVLLCHPAQHWPGNVSVWRLLVWCWAIVHYTGQHLNSNGMVWACISPSWSPAWGWMDASTGNTGPTFKKYWVGVSLYSIALYWLDQLVLDIGAREDLSSLYCWNGNVSPSGYGAICLMAAKMDDYWPDMCNIWKTGPDSYLINYYI